MNRIFIFFTFIFSLSCSAIDVYPTSWWTGMKNPKLQLMIHGDKVGAFTKVSISDPTVKLVKFTKAENVNYVFLDLTISPNAKPGTIKIKVNKANSSFDIPFSIV